MILAKTELGQQVLKDRSVRLTPRQRSMLVMCDGKRPAPELLEASQGSREDLDALLDAGLLADQAASAASMPSPQPAGAGPSSAAAPDSVEPGAVPRLAQERYQAAYPIAAQLTAGMGLRGFRLNLAVEAAGNWEELVGLLPKLRTALGSDKTAPLERALMS